jgi:histidinol-phosphate aminotransferase
MCIRDSYQSARSLATEAEVFLDANENPFSAFDGTELQNINRYPAPQPQILLKEFSKLYNVSPDMILLGRGSDEAIDTILRTFCEPKQDGIIICPPTYGVYEVFAGIQEARLIEVPLKIERTFELDVPGIIAAHSPEVKIVALCSPNNPTGSIIDTDALRTLVGQLSGKALIMLDEAYIEFSKLPSQIELIKEFPNLIVLRTLSKAWGMAGARCGVAIARPEIIELLQKVRAPYPLSLPVINLVSKALSAEGKRNYAETLNNILALKDELSKELKKLSVVEEVFPSEANFILVRVKDAALLVEKCRSLGIIVRDRSKEYGLKNCIRISVGTAEENERLIAVLKES